MVLAYGRSELGEATVRSIPSLSGAYLCDSYSLSAEVVKLGTQSRTTVSVEALTEAGRSCSSSSR